MPYRDPDTQRTYQREWRASRRAQWLVGKTCADCDRVDRLEIHHLDPSSKVSHKIWSWSELRREAELAKCVVLCRPCHEERHWPADEKAELEQERERAAARQRELRAEAEVWLAEWDRRKAERRTKRAAKRFQSEAA